VVRIIRTSELPQPNEVPPSLRAAAVAALGMRVREPRPVGFPLLFTSDMQLIEPAVAFLHEHLVQRAHSAETVRTYAEILVDWFDALEHNDIHWGEADAVDLMAYRNRMLSTPSPRTHRPYSIRTINHRVCGVLRFYEWAVRHQRLRSSPLTGRDTDFTVTRRYDGASRHRDPSSDRGIFLLRQFEARPRPNGAQNSAIRRSLSRSWNGRTGSSRNYSGGPPSCDRCRPRNGPIGSPRPAIAAANSGQLHGRIDGPGLSGAFSAQVLRKSISDIENTKRSWQRGIASVLLCACTAVEAGAPASPLPALKSVAVEVDITSLPASEQAALVPILRAARQIDAVYVQQVWPGTHALINERRAAVTSASGAELDALNFFKGPWGPTGAPFIDGVPSKQPIGDYYPSGTTKHDVDIWLGTLSEPNRKRALDSFTTIERGRNGSFEVVSYGRHYKHALTEAASALREAATLTHEATLKNYLTLRAQALLDDDYYASDVAFVDLKGPIDAVLGPYEVDDDAWFGAKTAYQASIGIVNERATQRIGGIATHLQELEDHLPLIPSLRGRKLGAAAPIVVLDVIYHGGFAGAGGAEAGYGLPNDTRVLDAVGARTGTYSNILKLRYDSTFRPMADAVLTDADRSTVRFENVCDEIMFVRIFDSLGPQFVTGTKQPIAEALHENAAVAAQIRSMLLSLWGHRYLIDHGYLDRREDASLYSAFLIAALPRVRGGLDSTPSQGSTYVLNHLVEAGAISVSAEGRLTINRAAADADIARAAAEFISLMAKGDAAAIKSLLQHYVVVTPTIRDVLARLGPVPPLLRPVYRTADRLSPPAH
jgi:Phage integrase, N-terminal SAM-like domain